MNDEINANKIKYARLMQIQYLYNNVVLAMAMPMQWSGLKTQSLLIQHYYYYYYADCYMQTKYIENYYNKGGPDIGD